MNTLSPVQFGALKLVKPLSFEDGRQSMTVEATRKDKKKYAAILGDDNRVTIAVKDDPSKRALTDDAKRLELGQTSSRLNEDLIIHRNGNDEDIYNNEQYSLTTSLLYEFNAMTEQFFGAVAKTFSNGMSTQVFKQKVLSVLSSLETLPLSEQADIVNRIKKDGFDSIFW